MLYWHPQNQIPQRTHTSPPKPSSPRRFEKRPNVAERWSALLAPAGEPWQRFGVCIEFTPSTLHKGQSAGSAGPTKGLIVRRGL
jgi:hypothetical protein